MGASAQSQPRLEPRLISSMLQIQAECFAQPISGFAFVSWRQEPISSMPSATSNSCKMVLAAWQGIILLSSDLSEERNKAGMDAHLHIFSIM